MFDSQNISQCLNYSTDIEQMKATHTTLCSASNANDMNDLLAVRQLLDP